MKYYLKLFLTILIVQSSLNAEIYNGNKINETLKKNIVSFFDKETSFEELKSIVKLPSIPPKGEFEKTKDYEERKSKLAPKLDLKRLFISNLDTSYKSYDADKENMSVKSGDSVYGRKEFYFYNKKNSYSYTNKYETEYGIVFEAEVLSSEDKIFSITDLNSFKLFDKFGYINFPLSIQEAKELKDKLKVKIIYQHQNSGNDYAVDYHNTFPTISRKYHYISNDEIIKIKPLAIIIYTDTNNIVAISTLEKLESLNNKLSTMNNK